MALEAGRQSDNICRTITRRIGNMVAVGATSYPVYPHFRWADPEKQRAPDGTPEVAFVALTWLQEGAGQKGFHLLQADVFSRVGAEGAADGDPFGTRARRIADELADVWMGLDGGGRRKHWIDVLDFTATPAAPTDTGVCLVCQNSRTEQGAPEFRTRPAIENGYQRITLRWRFFQWQDVAGAGAFYA